MEYEPKDKSKHRVVDPGLKIAIISYIGLVDFYFYFLKNR